MNFRIFFFFLSSNIFWHVFSEVLHVNRGNFTWNSNGKRIDFIKSNDFDKNFISSQNYSADTAVPNKKVLSYNDLDVAHKEYSEHTKLFFPSFNFNYSKVIDKCITDYGFLVGFLRKIALTFYYFNRIKKLEDDEFKRNSNRAWKIGHDNHTKININIKITKYNDEFNQSLSVDTLPGSFISNLFHPSDTNWIEYEVKRSQPENNTYKLVEILKNENNGVFSVIECICNFAIETQRNLGLNTTSIERCEEKIEDIILAMKMNPEAEFDLTQVSLDQPPSKLIIPDSIRGDKISRKWKESKVEGKELVVDYNFTSKRFKLVNTTDKGINIIRELLFEFNSSKGNTDSFIVNDNSDPLLNYFDSRDVNGKSCVYFPYDQGKCGACYAFVVSSSVSISNCIQESFLTSPLSPQQIIDCSQSFGNLGCNGGFYSNGWSYLLESNNPKNLFCSWEEYPYIESQKDCKSNKCSGCLTVGRYNVFTGLSLTGSEGWDFVTTILPKVGSISLSINSNLPGFASYSGGIYRAPRCTLSSELDHAVIMIGFGVSDSGEKYYVIQNSWGASWGISGFMNVSASSCDMFWYPGIIRQLPSDPIPEVCEGNAFLLAGAGKKYHSDSFEIKQNSIHFNIIVLIIALFLILI
ncbi:cathepsin like thiol protease membrane associated [Cryptosporidium ryanae]|uniref:cathepsin like thiol protease membrane associated n=1 Tax=Cryptosporidium ryanae TaxID=515981 RepID=UPI00351A2F20|nr:cathepsin like thiol protease membrane associated [Cryptosporidium ryanae]